VIETTFGLNFKLRKDFNSEDALDGLPNEVVDNYDAWVELYRTNFKEICDDPGDYSVHIFPTVMEEVAWNVAGFLLAWRIALAPHVGSVEFEVGHEMHVLRKGEDVENDVIYSFFGGPSCVFVRGGDILVIFSDMWLSLRDW
jgi:hypothetical protein